MGISRLSDRSNLVALIPDHPMHQAWRDYIGMFTTYKMGSFMAPEGAWFEYGASYHMHGYGKILRGLMGILSSEAPQADRDVGLQSRRLRLFPQPALAGGPALWLAHHSRHRQCAGGQPAAFPPGDGHAWPTAIPSSPPTCAGRWDASGQMVGTGADMITLPAMVRPEIAAKGAEAHQPHLSPAIGVIFRAHQGPDETCLYLRSGYMWSHWSQDQGNLMLYAKGAVLLPPQPYQYGGPKDNTFPDKNFLRFGAPGNDLPHDWADSNILDAHFGPSVDYAWSSTGYPDWFINPGRKKNFGKPREPGRRPRAEGRRLHLGPPGGSSSRARRRKARTTSSSATP